MQSDSGEKAAPVQITEGAFLSSSYPLYASWDHYFFAVILPSAFNVFISLILFIRRTSAPHDIDEAAVYDRQIRLWGLEAQQRCVSFIS